MAIDIIAPRMLHSIKEATLSQWVYSIGDAVMEGEVIIEIEAGKMILEVLAPETGIIKEVKIPVGQNVSGNEVLGIIISNLMS